MQNSGPVPDFLNQNMHFNQISRYEFEELVCSTSVTRREWDVEKEAQISHEQAKNSSQAKDDPTHFFSV